MKQDRESQALRTRARELEQRAQRQKWGVFHGAYVTVAIVIYALMIVWVCGAGWLIFHAVRQMIQTGRPLVIRGRPATWGASVGYVAVVLAIGVAGPACLAFVLRMLRTSLTASARALGQRKAPSDRNATEHGISNEEPASRRAGTACRRAGTASRRAGAE